MQLQGTTIEYCSVSFSISDFFTNSEPNACDGFLRECFFHVEKSIASHLTYHLLLFMCFTLSVGPLLLPRTLKHKCKKVK